MLVTRDYYTQFLEARGYGPDGPVHDMPEEASFPEGAEEIARFLHGLPRDTPICVLSDFDCDGLMAGTVWYLFLHLAGFSDVRIGERDTAGGYGLRASELSFAAGARVVVTSDVGTACRDLVLAAQASGMTTVVTDHHLCSPADSVKGISDYFCNPFHADGLYDGPSICGAMVVHRIAELYFRLFSEEADAEKLADIAIAGHFAAIATVADGMPMTGPNRAAVSKMLRFFSYAIHPSSSEPTGGLASDSLLQNVLDNFYRFVLRVTPGYYEGFDMDFLVYQVIPAINSVKRMGQPTALVYGMLFGDAGWSGSCVEALAALNSERKILVGQITEEFRGGLEEGALPYSHVFLLPDGTPPGTCGLVAQKMAELLGAPAVALLMYPDGSFSGSARSFGGWQLLSEVNKSGFARCAGHQAACGVYVPSVAMLGRLDRFLVDAFAAFTASAPFAAARPYDVLMDFDADCMGFRQRLGSFLSRIGRIGPFGNGFEAPLVCIKTHIRNGLYSGFGTGGTAHVRVDLGRGLRCLLWNTDLSLLPEAARDGTLYMTGTLSRHYSGRHSVIELAGTVLTDPPGDADLYEEYLDTSLVGVDDGDVEGDL